MLSTFLFSLAWDPDPSNPLVGITALYSQGEVPMRSLARPRFPTLTFVLPVPSSRPPAFKSELVSMRNFTRRSLIRCLNPPPQDRMVARSGMGWLFLVTLASAVLHDASGSPAGVACKRATEQTHGDFTQYVNTFIGSEGGGNVFPGATLPWGEPKGFSPEFLILAVLVLTSLLQVWSSSASTRSLVPRP